MPIRLRNVRLKYQTLRPGQRIWDDLELEIQTEYSRGLSYRQIKVDLDHRLESSVGLRTLNRRVLRQGSAEGSFPFLKKGEVPPVVRVDAIWHEDDLFIAKTTPATRNSVLDAIKGQYYDRVASYILNSMIIRLFKVSEGILGVSFDDNGAILFSLLDLDLNLLYQTPYYHSYFPLVEKDHCWNFYDDFSRASSGWAVGEDEDVRSEYLNGEYRVLTKNDDYYYMFMAPASCTRQYYQVEFDARWVGEPGYSYGIVYGINDDWSEYYLFGVNSEYQILDLYQIRDGFIWELSHRYSSAIRTGANTNHLKVTRKYEQLLLEINGIVVSDV
jgi:hypothetical protein